MPIGLGVQLLRLCVQGLQAVFHALAPALDLRQGNDPEQVGLGQPLELLVEPAARALCSCSRRACSSWGSQPPPWARARAWAMCSRAVSRAQRSCQTTSSSCCAGAYRAGQGVSCPLVIGSPLARQT